MKRPIALVALALVAFSLLAGGAQQSAEGQSLTLRFSWWGGEERHQATLAAIELYESRNPGVTIEAEYGGFDGYYQKLVTQLAGGTAPDIIQIDQPWLFELSSRSEVFRTLDSAVDLSGFDAKFLADFASYGGSVKGLPTGLNGEVLFLDHAFLSQYGIDPNITWTWENIVTEGAKVNKADPSKYFLNIAPDQLTFFLEKYLAQKGGAVVREDKSLGFTRQDAVDAFSYFQSWIDQKIIPPISETVLFNRKADENPAWINGNMGAMWTWTSNLSKTQGNKGNAGVASLPLMPGGDNSGVLVRPSQLLVVNQRSSNSAEALKFLDFFFNDPEAITLLGSSRGVPPTEQGRALLKDLGQLDELVEKGTAAALAVLGKPQTVWELNSEVHQILDDLVEQFAFLTLSPEAAADALISQLNNKLNSF